MTNEYKNAANTASVSLAEMRTLVRLVIWAALIGLGGWLSIPIPGVPLTMQTFFVILAGLAEGPKAGAMASGLYLLAGILGLPVFAGGLAGPAIFLEPSAGFALAFPLGAAISGLASRRARGGASSLGRTFLMCAAGSMTILLLGLAGLLINTGMDIKAAALLTSTFVPGDLAKSAAAASIVSAKFFDRLTR